MMRYLPLGITTEGNLKPIGSLRMLPSDDLFGSLQQSIVHFLGQCRSDQKHVDGSTLAALCVDENLALTLDLAEVSPTSVQCLVAAISRLDYDRRARFTVASPPVPYALDPACGLTLWDHPESKLPARIFDIWERCKIVPIDPMTALTTPRLYGNKLRLQSLIQPVIATSLPDGVPILDLMAGTGIVARLLADRHPLTTNDANPYAALLSKCQGTDSTQTNGDDIISKLRAAYQQNYSSLRTIVGKSYEVEANFAHGDLDEQTLLEYEQFTRTSPLAISDGCPSRPARLATERYANVYFGVAQCMEIDSLRYAIERLYPKQGDDRDLCLCALIVACGVCATGPHFAQPPKPKSLKGLRTIIERRTRSVSWEFDLALKRLIARRPPEYPFEGFSQGDWRVALSKFADCHVSMAGAVYVDPPYSKLQYSRYYHLFNVLLSYDYPAIHGTGRYPPREQRFSSRLEYQPGEARRELSQLIRMCRAADLSLFMSYSDGGFVPFDALIHDISENYENVTVYSQEIRHHSQGRALTNARSRVTEYVFVGTA